VTHQAGFQPWGFWSACQTAWSWDTHNCLPKFEIQRCSNAITGGWQTSRQIWIPLPLGRWKRRRFLLSKIKSSFTANQVLSPVYIFPTNQVFSSSQAG